MALELALPDEVWIEGQMRAGKDFIANLLIEQGGYVRLALADALKDEIATLHNITVAELEANKAAYRSEMQEYGVARREQDENYWITRWQAKRDELGPGVKVVVPDCRFPNEALYAIGRGKFVVRVRTPWRIRAQRCVAIDGKAPTKEQLAHPSEVAVNKLPCHLEVEGTLPLVRYIPLLEAGYATLHRLRTKLSATNTGVNKFGG